MNSKESSKTTFETLRKQAEKMVRGQGGQSIERSEYDEQDLMRLLYEVEAQQIELELQNDELRRTSKTLEHSRDEFAELYQSAPVAYVTLNEKRMIEQLNAAAVNMLAGFNGPLVGMPFSSLILPDDRDLFYSHLKETTSGRTPSFCELRLLATKGGTTDAQLHARLKEDAKNGAYRWQLVLIDVTARKRTESVLQEREAWISSILRAAPIGIGVVTNRVIQEVNDRFCEISGYTRNELIGQSAKIIYPSDREYEYVGKEKYRQIEKLGTGSVETRLKKKDGSIIDVIISSTPIDQNDLSQSVTFTVLDITEGKQAEKSLRQSEQLYHSLATNLPRGAAFVVDRDLRYVLAEGEALRLTGMTPDDLEGKTIHEALDPALAKIYEPHYRSALIGKEFRLEHFSHDRYYATHGVPLRDPEGLIYAVLAVSYDITERKEDERALRDSEKQLAFLIDAIPHLVWTARPDGTTEYCNQRTLAYLDKTQDQIAGWAWVDIIHPDDRTRVIADWQTVIETGAEHRTELRIQNGRTGEYRWFLSHAVPQLDDHGRILRWYGTSTDIHKNKIAEEFYHNYREQLEQEVRVRTTEIEAQYKELEALNSTIKKLSQKTIEAMESDRQALSKEIHDRIGGTLAAIKFQLEERINKTSRQKREIPPDLMPLEKIVRHLKNAINETRRISKHLRSMTLDDFGLKPALIEHIGHFKEFYPGIEVVTQIELPNRSIPTAVQTVVYRIIQEALNNAGRHSAATEVRVTLSDRDDQLHLEVADNGSGFEYHLTLSGKDPLSGFGIHSMRERVEICKGEFRIHSEPGNGTAVKVSIPI